MVIYVSYMICKQNILCVDKFMQTKTIKNELTEIKEDNFHLIFLIPKS